MKKLELDTTWGVATQTINDNTNELSNTVAELVDSYVNWDEDPTFPSENKGNSIVQLECKPNVFYKVGVVSNLAVTLLPNDDSLPVTAAYMFQFDSSAEGTTLTLPEGITWDRELAIQSGRTYQVMIINNYATYHEFGIGRSDDKILYTSFNGDVVDVSAVQDGFGATYNSNDIVDGKGVISFNGAISTIPTEAFRSKTYLTTVTIPSGVKTIGTEAISYCPNLLHIYNIPKGITIGQYALSNNPKITSITIPDGATIKYGALRNCGALASVTIGDGATMTAGAFIYGCPNLRYLHNENAMDNNRCIVKDGLLIAFAPSGVTKYTIPNSVVTIGDEAFRECDKLTNITIPTTVTSIGGLAFLGCAALAVLNVPSSVTKIGDKAFSGCTGTLTISSSVVSKSYGVNGNEWIKNSKFTAVEIKDVETIGSGAFYNCNTLTSVTIGSTVKTIGWGAFYYCTGLTSINIPDNATGIGDAVFVGCKNLESFSGKYASNDGRCLIKDNRIFAFAPKGMTSYSIPDNVTVIGAETFKENTTLASVTIPESVTKIEALSFYKCTSLEEVYCKATSVPSFEGDNALIFGDNSVGRKIYVPYTAVDSYREHWSNYADDIVAYDFENNKEWVEAGTTITYKASGQVGTGNLNNVASHTYDSTTKEGVITFEDKISELPFYAFMSDTHLMGITIPDSVTSIGDYAFNGCTSLESITIPDSVLTIGASAFEGCTALTAASLGENVTMLGENAFYGCTQLEDVTLGNKITSMGSDVFSECTSLPNIDNVYYAGTCAVGAVDYSFNEITFKTGTQYIATGAFVGTIVNGIVNIPSTVTYVGDSAFAINYGPSAVNINSNFSFGSNVFSGCSGELRINSTIMSRENFSDLLSNSNFSKVFIGDGIVTSVSGFANITTTLTEVTIGNSVTEIGYSAFSGCTKLAKVYCKPTTPPLAGGYIFSDTGCTIYVPTDSVDDYKAAEGWSEYSDRIEGYDF